MDWEMLFCSGLVFAIGMPFVCLVILTAHNYRLFRKERRAR